MTQRTQTRRTGSSTSGAGALDLAADPAGDGLYALPGLGSSGGVALLSRAGAVVSSPGLQGTSLESGGSGVLLSGPATAGRGSRAARAAPRHGGPPGAAWPCRARTAT